FAVGRAICHRTHDPRRLVRFISVPSSFPLSSLQRLMLVSVGRSSRIDGYVVGEVSGSAHFTTMSQFRSTLSATVTGAIAIQHSQGKYPNISCKNECERSAHGQHKQAWKSYIHEDQGSTKNLSLLSPSISLNLHLRFYVRD
uniref:Uncharacterized protein n=1 Tax=Parascaris univalens TaxID=6257 RepID=A0A915BYY2_PARUN